MLLIKTINTCYLEFLLKIYFYTWCVVILVSFTREVHVLCEDNDSNDDFPHKSGLCVNYSRSCTHQVRVLHLFASSNAWNWWSIVLKVNIFVVILRCVMPMHRSMHVTWLSIKNHHQVITQYSLVDVIIYFPLLCHLLWEKENSSLKVDTCCLLNCI